MSLTPSPPRLSPLHGRLSRTSSSRSTDSTIEMREWRPTQAVPLISVEGGTNRGGALVKDTIGRAEKNLSSLFVENERKAGTPDKSRRKKGWGGSLVDGAMNAGVFGAALGLTAYRFWSEPQSPTSTITPSTSTSSTVSSASTSASSSAGPSSLRSRPDSIEFPPPPAYTESDLARTAVAEEEGVWQDEEDTSNNLLKSIHSKNTPPRGVRHRKGLSKTRIQKTPTRSVASITVEDIRTPLTEHPPLMPVKPPEEALMVADKEDVEEEGIIDPVEVLHRLDNVSVTIRAMISEAQRALAAPSPVVISEGWIDEAVISPKTPQHRKAASVVSPTIPRSERRKVVRRNRLSLLDSSSRS